jgi:parallel beta-helix repeat protein
VLNNAIPGDTVTLAKGLYFDFQLIITNNGTDGLPIVFRAQEGGQVIFKGQSGLLIEGDYITVNGFVFWKIERMGDIRPGTVTLSGSEHVKVMNCAFYTCGHDKWKHILVLENGSSNNEIAFNYFQDIKGQGIGVIGDPDNRFNHIHHNHFKGTSVDGIENGQEPIQLGQATEHYTYELSTIVAYNLIEHMIGDADGELISNKSKGNKIRHNTLINNEIGKELVIRGGENCLVEHNFLDGAGIRAYGNNHLIRQNYISNAFIGIRLPGGDLRTYPDTFECTVADNLIVNSRNYGIQLGGQGPQVFDNTIEDNWVVTNTGVMFERETGLKKKSIWKNNKGSGSGRLRSASLLSGIMTEPPTISTSLKPLSPKEVGPDWR